MNDLVFFDFSMAFDCVIHSNYLEKLQLIGMMVVVVNVTTLNIARKKVKLQNESPA